MQKLMKQTPSSGKLTNPLSFQQILFWYAFKLIDWNLFNAFSVQNLQSQIHVYGGFHQSWIFSVVQVCVLKQRVFAVICCCRNHLRQFYGWWNGILCSWYYLGIFLKLSGTCLPRHFSRRLFLRKKMRVRLFSFLKWMLLDGFELN